MLLEWPFLMDVLLTLFCFLPGAEVVCSACCGDDRSFLHFTDTEHLAAMQEETWGLTEITMKIQKSSLSKKNQHLFFCFTGHHMMKRKLYCS